MRSKMSKIAIMTLVFCMSVSMLVINVSAADSESASDTKTYERYVSDPYDAETVAKYIAGDNTYPKKTGYVFAGWYTDADATSPLRDAKPGEKTYALFIPEQVLSVKAQVAANLTDSDLSNDASATLRFVTTVDSVKYDKVGFDLSYVNSSGKTLRATNMSDRVYEELYVAGTTTKNTKTVTPQSEFCNLSKYFRACTVTGLSEENGMYETAFTARPFWITLEGDKVYGVQATKKIVDGCLRDEAWVSTETDSEGNATGVNAINYGSYDYPYATLDYAIEHVVDGGIVHVKDSVTIEAGTKWNPHYKNVTITGDDKDDAVEKLIYTSDAAFDIYIEDGVTFTAIELTLPADYQTRIFAEGNKLVIKDDVTFTNESAKVQLLGGSQDSAVESTHLEVYAGTYSAIFGGSDTQNVLGDTKVIVGGKVNSGITATAHTKSHILFGAGWKGTVYGNTNIEVQSGAKFNYVFGGGDDAAATVKGSTNVSFAGEAMSIYGGSAAGVNGDTHVIMTGGYVEQIFGGSESKSMTGNTDVQVLGGTVARRIYGGCYNDYTWVNAENKLEGLEWKNSYFVNGYTSVTFGSNVNGEYATLKDDYPDDSAAGTYLSMDDSTYYAVSRSKSNYSSDAGKELGVFIVNDYNVNTNLNKDMAGYTDFMTGTIPIIGDDISTAEPYHYLVNATDGGEVYSAGDCIYIVPDKTDSATYVATVTIGGEIVHYTEEASYYPLPNLTSSTETIVVTFGDATSAKTDAQTTFINSAKATIGTAYYATEAQAVAAAEHMKDAVITLTANATEKLSSITILKSENGTVTTDKKNCIISTDNTETVTLTVTPDEGYNLTGLTVKKDGETVDVGITTTFAGGEYVFTPEAGAYTVEATFERKIFVKKTGWDVTTQYDGKVTLNSGRTGNSQWLDLYDTYGDIDITLTVRDCIGVIDSKPEVSSVIKLTFGDKYAAFRIGCLKEDSTQESADVYKVQSYGGTGSLYSWNSYGTLTTEEVAAYQSEQGLKFRLVRSGADVFLYVGDRRVCEAFDLRYTSAGVETYITAATKATVSIKQDGNLDSTDNPFAIEFPFELSAIAPERVTIDLPTCENGSFTTEFVKYLAGDAVKLTVNGDSGYYYNSLALDGKAISADLVDWEGNYTFKAENYYYKVTGSFAPEIFGGTYATNWYLVKQNVGVIKPNPDVNTDYMETKENYSVFSMTLKNTSQTEISIGTKFTFDNGKELSVQVWGKPGGYRIKSCHKAALYGNGLDYYKFSTEQAKKVDSEDGLELTMVRCGTKVMFYLDGERVTGLKVHSNGTTADCLDVSKDYVDDSNAFYETPVDSGVTASSTSIVKIAAWSSTIEIPFTLSNDVPATVTFDSSQSTNGTVTSNLGVCLVGDMVTLTATPNEGYDCTGMIIDGTDVTENAVVKEDGTCTYTFKATNESYMVEPVYKQIVNVNITQAENGTISKDKAKHYLGDTVVISVEGNSGYYYDSLTVNNKEEKVNNAGTYSFTATETKYNIGGSFKASIFETGQQAHWNIINQHKGIVVHRDDHTTDQAYVNFVGQHTNSDVTLMIKDFEDNANNGFRIAIGYYSGSPNVNKGYSIIQEPNGTYSLGCAYSGQYGNRVYEKLSGEEMQLLQSEEGIAFRVVKIGNQVSMYLDGELKYTETISELSNTNTTNIWIKVWDSVGDLYEIPFQLSTVTPTAAIIDMSNVIFADADGTSLGTIQAVDTTDPTGETVKDISEMSYIVGQKVVLKVNPSDGYYHNLKVNGEPVVLDYETMTYSFIAKENNVITGTFDTGIFETGNDKWNLLNQNAGCLVANYEYVDGDDDSNWLNANGDYQEISTIVKDYTGGTTKNFAVVLKLTFSGGKYVAFRLYGNNGDYMVQSFNTGGIYGWSKSYALDSTIDNKIKGNDGVVFKMALRDTDGSKWLDIWVDDVDTPLDSLELTAKDSSITTSTTVSSASIRHYNNAISDNYLVEVPFTLAEVQPTTVSVSESENGTVTVNSAVNYIGDVVVLAVTSKEGYA